MIQKNREMEKLTAERENELKDFVEGGDSSRIQHSIEFKRALEKTYGNCRGKYYILSKNGRIEALFPFFIVKSGLFGNRMISVPFLDVGGFLGDYDESDIAELIGAIKKDCGKKLKHIEIRTNSLMPDFEKNRKILADLGFSEDSGRQQMIIELTGEEDLWKRFHKHTRNEIRKAEGSGLKINPIENENEIKGFYGLYSREMRNFGTPQHSLKFFRNIFSAMREKSAGFNCYHEGKLIASLILFFQNRHAYVAFNVSEPKFRIFKPNDLLYWTAIKFCMHKGAKYLDIGQIEQNVSKDSKAYSLYKFKKKWLGREYARSYFYLSMKEGEKESARENMEKYKRFRALWKKLPAFAVKIIGPRICAQLGV